MFQFNYSLKELKAKPIIAFKGAIICDTESERLTRYIIKDVANDIPILIEIGDKSKTVLPNWIGDYMLNLRTGYISLVGDDYKITDPIGEKRLNINALEALQREYIF